VQGHRPIDQARSRLADTTVMDPAELLEHVLSTAVARGASDIRLKVPSPPLVRVNGALEYLDLPALGPDQIEAILAIMMAGLPHAAKQTEFDRRGEVDFAFTRRELGRFRVNAFRQRGSISIVLRLVPYGVRSLSDLNLPDVVRQLAELESGLVLVCGPASSGTTSTMAAIIDHVNRTQTRAIVTIEDPIEVLHSDDRSAIDQREVGLDTLSAADGLASVLRQDPDIVQISHLGDLATAEAALHAAEAGALVVAGVTTQDVFDAFTRIVGFFPLHRQGTARQSLAACLRGALGMRLVRTPGGLARQPAVEIVRGTPEIRAAIASSDPPDRLIELMSTGEEGMQTLDQALARLVASDQADINDATEMARDARVLRLNITHAR
jgi:twitching motility protein PilT